MSKYLRAEIYGKIQYLFFGKLHLMFKGADINARFRSTGRVLKAKTHSNLPEDSSQAATVYVKQKVSQRG